MVPPESAYQNSETPESMEESMEGGEGTSIAYSPSVNRLLSEAETGSPVSSMELVRGLVRIHPEYADGRLEKVIHGDYASLTFASKLTDEWGSEVEQLFDPEKVPELHGRLFVLGLCELDGELKKVFTEAGVLEILHDELKEEFAELLKKGSVSGDPAVLHLDSDAQVDRLGREGFVEALATWLNRFWRRSNPPDFDRNEHSFMVHLHGPWGSGKSTLLNLLEQKLAPSDDKKEKEEAGEREQEQEQEQDSNLQWMVIHFNAWQHSHVEPVWWPLLNQIYKESRQHLKQSGEKEKARSIWWYDFYWKLISGNKSTAYWFAFFVVVLILASIPYLDDRVQFYIRIGTLAGSVVTGFSYFFRSLIWGSADSAREYLNLSQDPLDKIKVYFREIIRRIDRPVMIYIDDLDRCPSPYVVDLLESLQTLFNDSRVFYVLAADRRWLYGSFEERYGEFRKHIEEPGKQIGYLFLDKLFQLSISVPQVSPEVRENYLNYLYLDEKNGGQDIEEIRQQAREEFEQVTSESELIGKLGRGQGDSGVDQIRREEAVRASAKVEIEASTEYFLKQFAHLLEPNPRSIKRLVNNYGIYRAIVMLSDPMMIDTEEKREKFALWNIVAMRWPLLAEYMEDERQQIPFVVDRSVDQIEQKEIKELVAMRDVQDVLKGDGIGTSLDAGYVERVLNLQAAPA